MERIDKFFIKYMKKMTKVVYTAHNVLPHVNGEDKKEQYADIYNSVDKIIVHGCAIKKELLEKFNINEDKIYIQMYGFSQLEKEKESAHSFFVDEIRNKKKEYKKIVMCLGLVNRYKGIDRILRIWNRRLADSNNLLVVAGKINENFKDLDREIKNKAKNIIIENRHLTDVEFSALSEVADLIILPYRNASMSGVIYSAARAKTTILATKTGAISEYLENDYDSKIVDNDDSCLEKGMIDILDKDELILKEMGKHLFENFQRKFRWSIIVNDLKEGCYLK